MELSTTAGERVAILVERHSGIELHLFALCRSHATLEAIHRKCRSVISCGWKPLRGPPVLLRCSYKQGQYCTYTLRVRSVSQACPTCGSHTGTPVHDRTWEAQMRQQHVARWRPIYSSLNARRRKSESGSRFPRKRYVCGRHCAANCGQRRFGNVFLDLRWHDDPGSFWRAMTPRT